MLLKRPQPMNTPSYCRKESQTMAGGLFYTPQMHLQDFPEGKPVFKEGLYSSQSLV